MITKRLLYILSLAFLFAACDNSADSNFDIYQWEESTAVDQGIQADKLEAAFSRAEMIGSIDGLVIVKNGYLIREAYYNGYSETRDHNVYSVSKSFLSAIAGIAIEQGYLTLEDKMMDYFPEYVYDGIDPRKYDVTVEHLLTMRMGIEGESTNNYSVYNHFYYTSDWIKAAIEAPLQSDPGERMLYNTFETHLLSAIINKATGRSIRDFAQEFLFNPMGISLGDWQSQNGYHFGGNTMHFTPKEMAVLGQLYLNKGRINDIQIIPESWVDLTTSPSTAWGQQVWGQFHDYNYGYLWWVGKINFVNCYMALGYGGQYIIVFPEMNLIVAATSQVAQEPEIAGQNELAVINLVAQYVLPAVTR
ncbi:MAG: beta-lactamase family protein [Bacteroidetes bacterium]|nr:beta-lactamase family protein [Bacteroidota bacterium]